MSFSIKDNLLMRVLLLVITIGIVLGSGSLYRFAYSYNMIMFGTILLMAAVIFFQFFIPTSSQNHYFSEDLRGDGINYSGLILIMFFIFYPILSDVFNQVESYEITYFYIIILMMTFLLGANYREKILAYYLKIIVLLSFISLIYYFTAFFSELPSYVPYYGIAFPKLSHFYYVWSVPHTQLIIIRNQSIFWEPGAFGFHLIIATLLAFKAKKKLFIAILVFTCLTTLSTTVFVFLIFLTLYQLFYGTNKISFISKLFVTGIILMVTIKVVFGNFELLQYLMKIITEKLSPSGSAYASMEERNLYVFESLKLFLDHFLLGAGHYATNTLLTNIGSETSALAGLLAEMGIFGVFCILLYIRFFYHFRLFAIPIALIWLNGEYLQYSPIALFILAHSVEDFSYGLFPDKQLNLSESTAI